MSDLAAASAIDAGTRLPAEHFALVSVRLQPSIPLNLPQPLRDNKTVGLVAWKGAAAGGD
ncbi:hypothetical protein [Mycobacterium sp. 852002-51971_SCH5477799-a]|uniref:hypothetical protein n=1 Tax=Mycobacterium sp. 852002-51971_SCH5477799-a TaxID=1834106 RepID=UPI0012E7D7AF|nr:hypothetical protein [Mycobacterium sp. 852002-51971_SCH5477799-a]